MALATQTLNKQKRAYFSYLWRGLALMGIGIFAGATILINGVGNMSDKGRGLGGMINKQLAQLMAQSPQGARLVPLCMAGFFFLIAAIGLYNVIRGVWQMPATHTLLGKSILTQIKGGEDFRETLHAIDDDMEQEPYDYGGVSIGRRWILGAEAMRLTGIRGVFCWDAGMEDHVLCCVDDAQNIWACGLRYSDDRDKAAECLQSTLPNLATGDKNAYIVFMGGQPEDDGEKDDGKRDDGRKGESGTDSEAAPPELPRNAVFSFVSSRGIPTSNFTPQEVCAALRALEAPRAIALRVVAPADSPVTEVSFQRQDDRWELGMVYRQDDQTLRAVRNVGEREAEDILEGLLQQRGMSSLFRAADRIS